MEITDGKTGWMKRKLMIACGVFLLIGIIFLVSSFLTLDFLVDYWWYDALGYAFYFLQRLAGVVATAFGWEKAGFPFEVEQGMGAYLMVALFLI